MVLLRLLACANPAPALEPVGFCDGPVSFLWDPEGALDVFPDDHWTVPADTPTGRRVATDTADHPFLAEEAQGFAAIYDDLATLDGWGLSSGLWFRADGPLPATLPEVRVVADGVDWPVILGTTDEGATLTLLPLRPLPEATEVTVVVRTDPAAPDCLAPAAHTRALLDPATADPPEQAERYRTALDALGIDPATVAAMSVYTTQSATAFSRAVAADVATRDYTHVPGACTQGTGWRRCDGTIEVGDYREDDHIVAPDADATPRGTYTLPTRVWLPDLGAAPWPTVLCGHGLGGDKGQCQVLADMMATAGEAVAVVAVDAVEHGEHPERTEADISILDDLMILAITVDPPGLVARRLRDNFRQSAWDKLQLLRAMEAGADVDGDGAVDLDAAHVAYAGVSLGAIMGPEPMALTDAMDGGVLLVGGARIASIISDSPTFSVLVDLMRPAGTTDGEVDRFFPVLQTVIDAGDPAVYAPHLVDRFDGGAARSVFDGMAWQDEIVPNSTNEALARALGLPGVGREEWAVPGLDFEAGPVAGNLPGGATGGVVQFSWVQESEGGEWVPASHDNLHGSVTGQAVLLDFLLPLLAGETPVVAEPERPEG